MAFTKKARAAKLKASKPPNLYPVGSELIVPDQFRCPISLHLMRDPVTTPMGITYDREGIEKWLEMGMPTCPVTSMALAVEDLIPNHNIRRMIQSWCVANGSRGIERIPTPRIPVSPHEASQILSKISLAVQSRDVDQCLQYANILRAFVKDSERNRRCFLSNGASSVLANAFRVSAAASLKLLANIILAALAQLLPFEDEAALLELSASESLNSIISIMRHGDLEGRFNAVLLVKKMAFAKAISEKNEIMEALSIFIKEPMTMQATKASLVALFYLMNGEKKMVANAAKLNLIPRIIEILVDSDKSMTEKALAVLDELCCCDQGRETACENALTIPVLAKKMFRISDTATELSVSSLWKLCKNCKKCLVECLQVGVFQKSLLLLQVGCSESTKERATELLKLMSGYNDKLECVDTNDFKGLIRPPL